MKITIITTDGVEHKFDHALNLDLWDEGPVNQITVKFEHGLGMMETTFPTEDVAKIEITHLQPLNQIRQNTQTDDDVRDHHEAILELIDDYLEDEAR